MVELLKEHREIIKELTDVGIIAPHWLRDLRIAEAYEQLHMDCQMCKYEILAGRFRLDSDTIRKIVRKITNK